MNFDLLTLSVYDYVGAVGVICVIYAFFALESGRVRIDGYAYWIVNGAGALLIMGSLLNDFNLSAFALQIIWFAISIRGLLRARLRTKT